MTGEADGMNLQLILEKRGGDAAYVNERSMIFNKEMVDGREVVTTDEERVLQGSRTEIRLLRQLDLCEDLRALTTARAREF